MGSGGMSSWTTTTCMVDIARYFVTFTQNESCGKCVPCRIGTRQMRDDPRRHLRGARATSRASRSSRRWARRCKGSLCGLGQTAPNPVLTTLKLFPRRVSGARAREALSGGRVPAAVRRHVFQRLSQRGGYSGATSPSWPKAATKRRCSATWSATRSRRCARACARTRASRAAGARRWTRRSRYAR